jgi:hypothetical protein
MLAENEVISRISIVLSRRRAERVLTDICDVSEDHVATVLPSEEHFPCCVSNKVF